MKAKDVRMLNIDLIDLNEGQMDGLPGNPRDIYKDEYEALTRSIQEDPEMLELRPLIVYPYEGRYIVIGGNMRLNVLRGMDVKEVPCCILSESTTKEDLMAYTILDNVHAGDWSDDLHEEWDAEELHSWDASYYEPVEIEDEPEEKMVTLSITFDSDDFKRVKQELCRYDKDSGKAVLMMLGYGE